MEEVTIVFPNQLFEKHPALDKKRAVVLAEEYLLFKVQYFHKQRLVLLRAAMKSYAKYLEEKGFSVIYIESSDLNARGDLFKILFKKGVKKVFLADFEDDWLQQDLDHAEQKFKWEVISYPTVGFLCSHEDVESYFGSREFSMARFYAHQRKKLSILMKNGKPVGDKFSFDAENRKKAPKKLEIPPLYIPKRSKEVSEAIEYVDKHFPESIGKSDPFLYPVNFEETKKALDTFIKERLHLFGDYEDAISQNNSFLFHSVLSPLINIGLLTPKQVLEAVLAHHERYNIPLNSLEGFIRQIIGWREYMRAAYLRLGGSMRTSNYFKHTNPLPKGFWDGTTGILPIDHTIRQILETGYCHHIQRLMVLGNFLLLTETDPNAVYEWFMGYFVDSYDWVMVPNVYAMSQYASRGDITTKPYISGSNYILKMSDYPKGEWTEIWDGLFWRFFEKHMNLFTSNPRMNMLAGYFDNNKDVLRVKIERANDWQKKSLKI